MEQFNIKSKTDEKKSRPFFTLHCPARYSVLYIFRVVMGEVFANAKVKLLCSEVCASHK